ncbi:hypothetical protein ACM41_13010 [Bradyrhizobium sp. CCBAU 21362]|nr:hypothetical protein [Bradyrhizobium sp. CCBAU 21362]
MTVAQLAMRLRIVPKLIYVQLKRGSILPHREPQGRFFFPDNSSSLQTVHSLRHHPIAKIYLMEDHHEKKGHQSRP